MKALRKPLSLFMALLMCLGVFVGTGTTAFAAGETMTTYMIDLPRASDPNKAGWGHPALNFLGGWSTGENDSFSVHTQDAFNGRAIYCIEPGIGVNTGDQYTGRGEDFWDNYPSNLNPTIPPDTIKEYIGRIMTYGWQGYASTSWMSGNPEDASKIAGYIAIITSRYWNMVHGTTPQEVMQDREGLATLRTLGHNMAYFLKCKEVGSKLVPLPPEEPWEMTNFIR